MVPLSQHPGSPREGLTMKKPYQAIAIEDCGEPLVALDRQVFSLVEPHPYAALGADYGGRSPYSLRQSVVGALILAQERLQTHHPGHRLQIFDAYRPIAVQRFMVNHSFQALAHQRGQNPAQCSPQEKTALLEEVYQFWALPSDDPRTPPPHSTGAAVDLTVIDPQGIPWNMGGAIDDIAPHSHPDFYHQIPEGQGFHHRRQALRTAMVAAGFHQHPNEWWHFSLGDQLWAWLEHQQYPHRSPNARYGGV